MSQIETPQEPTMPHYTQQKMEKKRLEPSSHAALQLWSIRLAHFPSLSSGMWWFGGSSKAHGWHTLTSGTATAEENLLLRSEHIKFSYRKFWL